MESIKEKHYRESLEQIKEILSVCNFNSIAEVEEYVIAAVDEALAVEKNVNGRLLAGLWQSIRF